MTKLYLRVNPVLYWDYYITLSSRICLAFYCLWTLKKHFILLIPIFHSEFFWVWGKYGYGWVRTFNQNAKVAVLQSGFLSEFIHIEKGCRQGDPTAAYLFIISAQKLLLLVENNKCTGGIKIGRANYKITPFTNDTTLILDGTSVSLLAALNTCEYMDLIQGLKLIPTKPSFFGLVKRFSTDKLVDEKKLI